MIFRHIVPRIGPQGFGPRDSPVGFSEDVASGPGRERFVRPGSVIYARTIRVSLALVAAR
jgi:hypothetical protein